MAELHLFFYKKRVKICDKFLTLTKRKICAKHELKYKNKYVKCRLCKNNENYER